jgi:hypothetical protein
MPSALLFLFCLWDQALLTLPRLASNSQSSSFYLLSKWGSRHMPPHSAIFPIFEGNARRVLCSASECFPRWFFEPLTHHLLLKGNKQWGAEGSDISHLLVPPFNSTFCVVTLVASVKLQISHGGSISTMDIGTWNKRGFFERWLPVPY